MTRINTGVFAAAIDTLNGARRLPPKVAIEKLDSFLDALAADDDGPFTAAAKTALDRLVTGLREHGSATDDVWGQAIERMVSLSNNPDFKNSLTDVIPPT